MPAMRNYPRENVTFLTHVDGFGRIIVIVRWLFETLKYALLKVLVYVK